MIRVDILIFYTRNRTFASPVPYFFHKKNWLIGQFFYAGLLYLVRQPLDFFCARRWTYSHIRSLRRSGAADR